MQFSAAAPEPSAQAHDGVAVDAGEALHGADAHSLSEGGNNLDLLITRKNVHGGPNPSKLGDRPKRDSGKTAWNPLYKPEWSFASGPNPGVCDPDRHPLPGVSVHYCCQFRASDSDR